MTPITNGLKLYCKSMGKVFRVTHIAKSDEEANEYCRTHDGSAVIADDFKNGLVFIAEKYSLTVPSSALPDEARP